MVYGYVLGMRLIVCKCLYRHMNQMSVYVIMSAFACAFVGVYVRLSRCLYVCAWYFGSGVPVCVCQCIYKCAHEKE